MNKCWTPLTRHHVHLLAVRPIVVVVLERALHEPDVVAARERLAAQNVAERGERVAVRPQLLDVERAAHRALVLRDARPYRADLLLDVGEAWVRGHRRDGAEEVAADGKIVDGLQQRRFVEERLDDVQDGSYPICDPNKSKISQNLIF